jgi:hypothetical protein
VGASSPTSSFDRRLCTCCVANERTIVESNRGAASNLTEC